MAETAISETRDEEPRRSKSRGGERGLGRTQSRVAGRFRSHYTASRLYEVVRKAALCVRPDHPKELRQTEFDSARAAIGHAEAPSARQIATRLKRSWRDIVSAAVDKRRNQAQIDSVAARTEVADWVSADHIYYALRRVADTLGEESLTRDRYAAARQEMIAADIKRHRFGGVLEENLPTVNQLESAARALAEEDASLAGASDWEKVLAAGGMHAPAARKKDALEMHVAIHYYIEATGGYLPRSEGELDRFRKTAGIAVKRRPKGKTFEDNRREAVAYRKKLGLDTTGEIPKPGITPEFDLSKLDVGALPVAVKRLSKQEKIEKVAAYLDNCDTRGVKPTQKHYKALAADRGWPAGSRLGEGMTWGQWVKEADVWRHEQAKKAA